MKLAQFQRDALLVLRTMLNADDPDNHAADDIKEHLRTIKIWLTDVPELAIDVIDSPPEHGNRWMREEISNRARRIRVEQRRGAHSADRWPTDAHRKGLTKND